MLKLGRVYPTQAALDLLTTSGEPLALFLARHQRGDAGDIHKWAVSFDEEYLSSDRVHSIYRLKTGDGIWITTEAERAITTVLAVSRTLIEEYDIRA